MEVINYVELNEHGSAVLVGTRIHVEAIGFAYEDDYTEAEILEWFDISKEQLHGVLAYFYRHRDALVAREQEAAEYAKSVSSGLFEKLKARQQEKKSE